MHKNKAKKILLVAVSLIIAAVVAIIFLIPSKQSKSTNLESKITALQKFSSCKEGLKSIGNLSLDNYSNQAKDDALNYLTNCYVVRGNYNKAKYNSNILVSDYKKEGNNQAIQKLQPVLNIINNAQK